MWVKLSNNMVASKSFWLPIHLLYIIIGQVILSLRQSLSNLSLSSIIFTSYIQFAFNYSLLNYFIFQRYINNGSTITIQSIFIHSLTTNTQSTLNLSSLNDVCV